MIRTAFPYPLLALVACSDAVAPDVSQLAVTLYPSRTELVPGDTVRFRIVAHNPTGQVIGFRTNACVLALRVRTRGGETVFQAPHTCNDIALLHELSPGDSIEETIDFDGTTTWGPFRDGNGDEPELVLAPGTYEAIGFVTAAVGNASAPVDLRVRPLPR